MTVTVAESKSTPSFVRSSTITASTPPSTTAGLSRDWGSCRDGCWRMRIVGGLEALPEAGAERAVVDGAANLEQQVGPAPGLAPLLRLGPAPTVMVWTPPDGIDVSSVDLG